MTEVIWTGEVTMIGVQMVTMMTTIGMTLDHTDISMIEVSSLTVFGVVWAGEV